MSKAADGNKSHQRLVSALVENDEPDSKREQRDDQDRPVHCQTETQNARHGQLEHNKTDHDAVADDGPCSTGGMLTVVHRIEKLVFVGESSNDKIQQAKKQHKPGARQNAIHDANNEDEYRLRKVEAIAEDGGLHQFCVICVFHQLIKRSEKQARFIPRGVLAPIR